MRDGCRSQRRLPLRTVTNGPCLCPEMRNEHTSGTAARRRRPQQPKSNAAESACTSGGARAGVGTGISEGSPRCRRIFWMAGVWSIKAIRRRRPSQRGQARHAAAANVAVSANPERRGGGRLSDVPDGRRRGHVRRKTRSSRTVRIEGGPMGLFGVTWPHRRLLPRWQRKPASASVNDADQVLVSRPSITYLRRATTCSGSRATARAAASTSFRA
jgi:hypothetical protein